MRIWNIRRRQRDGGDGDLEAKMRALRQEVDETNGTFWDRQRRAIRVIVWKTPTPTRYKVGEKP